jgi:hypothetical protein
MKICAWTDFHEDDNGKIVYEECSELAEGFYNCNVYGFMEVCHSHKCRCDQDLMKTEKILRS